MKKKTTTPPESKLLLAKLEQRSFEWRADTADITGDLGAVFHIQDSTTLSYEHVPKSLSARKSILAIGFWVVIASCSFVGAVLAIAALLSQ